MTFLIWNSDLLLCSFLFSNRKMSMLIFSSSEIIMHENIETKHTISFCGTVHENIENMLANTFLWDYAWEYMNYSFFIPQPQGGGHAGQDNLCHGGCVHWVIWFHIYGRHTVTPEGLGIRVSMWRELMSWRTTKLYSWNWVKQSKDGITAMFFCLSHCAGGNHHVSCDGFRHLLVYM